MAKNIIIYIPDHESEQVVWFNPDEKNQLRSKLQYGTLDEISNAVAGQKVHVVIPSTLVTLVSAQVPGSKSKALKAIPFALEEMLCEDVDALHFAIADKSTDGGYPVAVISQEVISKLLQRFDHAGVRPVEMRPEALSLPLPNEKSTKWVAYIDDEIFILRLGQYTGYSVDIHSAAFLLEQSIKELPDDEIPELILYTQNKQQESVISALMPSKPEVRRPESLSALFAEGISNTSGINLLQGDYSYKQQFDRALKPWLPAASLVVVLFMLFGAGKIIQGQQLGQQIEAQQLQMSSILKRAFPSIKRVVRPEKQMQTELKKLGARGVDSGFVSVMNEIRIALEFAGNTNLNSISYKTGRINLDMDTDALGTLDKFKKKLENQNKFTMKIESANQKDGRIRGRIRVDVKG